MLRALRPCLATTGGRLVILSSPYGQSGALWDLHRKHFGKDGAQTLIWQGSAIAMNPTLPADYLARMQEEDPEAYRSEVLGEFRAGWASLLDPDTLDQKKPRALTEKEWLVDVRTAVNYNCRPPVRIPVARPKWAKWGGLLLLEVDRDFFATFDPLTDLLNVAGRFGIGAGRNRKEQRGRQMVWSGMNLGKYVAELKV
jgi:hypothetical protein